MTRLAKKKLLKMIGLDISPELRAEAGRYLCALGDSRDLKAWIKIPAGVYRLSRRKGKDKEITLPAFELGQYPVTNGWFAEFMADGGYSHDGWWTPEGLKWRETLKRPETRFWNHKELNLANHPVVGVNWYEARAFCNWLTEQKDDGCVYRLPSEDEWEAAASGPQGRIHPWGDDWQEGLCNSRESGIQNTSAVGIFPGGATPNSLMDMAGNVWEWTCTDYYHGEQLGDFPFDEDLQALYEQNKLKEFFEELSNEKRDFPTLRGGSWDSYRGYMACRARILNHPLNRNDDVGFRIARTQVTL